MLSTRRQRRRLSLSIILTFAPRSTPLISPVQRRRASQSAVSSFRPLQAMANETETGGLFLFDFDGVVCDSCDECTVSALKTCQKLGVLQDSDAPEYPPTWLFDKMREIRPAIEVGWQIPVLLSVLFEQHQRGEESSSGPVGEHILSNHERLVQEWLDHWKLTDKAMIDMFGG